MEARALMSWSATVTFVLIAATTAAAPIRTTSPRILASANAIDLVLPSSILDNREMQKQLTSGLTTVVVTTIDDRDRSGSRIRGAVRLDIRYDLWDETYITGVTDISGKRQELSFPSATAFDEWWSRTAFRIANATTGQLPSALHVRTEVIPFSAEEEADAQRWLTRSLSHVESRPNPNASATAANRSILDAIIGTSVQRRPILAWRWAVAVGR
jgi:hypothetical protein